ncbi:MAG: DUF4399 domain-containing protein [Alphaproteobacteria bacterium]
MIRSICVASAMLAMFAIGTAAQARSPAPEGARVFFVNIADGDTVSSPFTVQFGTEGIQIAPANVMLPGSGHHHLYINTPLSPQDIEYSIPSDDRHIHYGAGQTEAQIWLPAGTHSLQLVMGDGGHVPHDPPIVSEIITITVE